MGKVVVHGVKGERRHYKPVKSILTKSADPLELGRALKDETGCKSLYIADLDAIQGQGDNLPVIRQLASNMDIDLWVDAGISGPEPIPSLIEAGARGIILGSETLKDLSQLKLICKSEFCKTLIFSLDMMGGRIISHALELKGKSPRQAMDLLVQFGIKRFILLSLDAVGTAKGPDLPLLSCAMEPFKNKFFIAGGGVKNPAHLKALHGAGMDAVLVATALHKGWITRQDLVPFEKKG